MRIKDNETYGQWSERVRIYELGEALKQLGEGGNPNEILENMSKRITNKIMHPIVMAIRGEKTEFDADASRKNYEENYLKTNGRKSDHVSE